MSITATFINNTDTRQVCTVADTKVSPPELKFQDYLDAGGATPALAFDTGTDTCGAAMYATANGGQQVVDMLCDGDNVKMK